MKDFYNDSYTVSKLNVEMQMISIYTSPRRVAHAEWIIYVMTSQEHWKSITMQKQKNKLEFQMKLIIFSNEI